MDATIDKAKIDAFVTHLSQMKMCMDRDLDNEVATLSNRLKFVENPSLSGAIAAQATARVFTSVLTDLKSTIINLLTSLGEKMNTLDAFVKKAENQNVIIHRLPAEIICIIVGYAAESHCDINKFTRVCSRFYTVINDSPQLWSMFEISSGPKARKVHYILKRTSDMPLRCGVYSHTDEDAIRSILLQKDRIIRLRIGAPFGCFPMSIRKEFRGAKMPRLEYLDAREGFAGYWDFPSLRHLIGYEVPNFKFGEFLSSCTIHYAHPKSVKLHRFLSASPQLRELDLCYLEFYDKEDAQPIIQLSNLKRLTLSSGSNETNVDSQMMTLFQHADLDFLSIVITTGCSVRERQNVFLRFIRRSRSLKSLIFNIKYHTEHRAFNIWPLLGSLPAGIQSLTIGGTKFHLYMRKIEGSIPTSLKTLHFTDSNRVRIGFLQDLRAKLDADGVKLEIIKIDEGQPVGWQAIFPESRFEF